LASENAPVGAVTFDPFSVETPRAEKLTGLPDESNFRMTLVPTSAT
jgi:hypothetical protein